ncbi:hypothetical protein ACH5AO_32395 [Streptomyces sp. NPDC018964]|uniref:hypothetical protein n=1 Tax=unclassified Streptomyces TaxID=2593676 RepID=UPI0037A803E3
MASQKKPPVPDGADGAGGSSVRRAVSLGSAAADPGPMLAPAARRTAAPEPGEGGTGRAEAARPAPDTAGSEAAPEQPAATAATSAAATTAATAGEPAAKATASAAEERPEAKSGSAAEPTTALRAAPDAAAGAAGAVGGVGGTATAGAAGADGPPSGNPKKPLLAAAGIAGVVLLAVPLLIWATDDSRQEKKKEDVAVAAGSDTLLDEEPLEVPKGAYAPAEPTPEPSTKKPSAKPEPVVKKEVPAPVTSSAAPVSESPEAKEKKTQKAEARVEEREAPKVPPNTAAYAVQRLAASDPGRHICYRVHRKGAGWTTPRCDGAMSGKGLPITAINIAVVGAKKVSANEFVQKDGWTTPWSSAADATDLTLGSDSPNAPNLSGYAIGVDDGNVCHHHKLGGHDWGAYQCESSQGWRFGGSLDPDVWLESVKFNL